MADKDTHPGPELHHLLLPLDTSDAARRAHRGLQHPRSRAGVRGHFRFRVGGHEADMLWRGRVGLRLDRCHYASFEFIEKGLKKTESC